MLLRGFLVAGRPAKAPSASALPTCALGIESSFTKHMIVNNELTLGLSASWYPGLWAKDGDGGAAARGPVQPSKARTLTDA